MNGDSGGARARAARIRAAHDYEVNQLEAMRHRALAAAAARRPRRSYAARLAAHCRRVAGRRPASSRTAH